METIDKRPIALLGIDTKTIFDRLCAAKVGDTIAYAELSSLIGRDIRGMAHHCLASARRKALNEKQIVFATVSKVGVKRLNDVEIVATGEDTVSRIRRMSKRSLRTITAVQDYDRLPNGSKVLHNTYASVLGVVAHISSSRQINKLSAKVEQSAMTLPVQKTIEALREAGL